MTTYPVHKALPSLLERRGSHGRETNMAESQRNPGSARCKIRGGGDSILWTPLDVIGLSRFERPSAAHGHTMMP